MIDYIDMGFERIGTDCISLQPSLSPTKKRIHTTKINPLHEKARTCPAEDLMTLIDEEDPITQYIVKFRLKGDTSAPCILFGYLIKQYNTATEEVELIVPEFTLLFGPEDLTMNHSSLAARLNPDRTYYRFYFKGDGQVYHQLKETFQTNNKVFAQWVWETKNIKKVRI